MSSQGKAAQQKENWASGEAYEPYVGRWSRLVAREFLSWLACPKASRWLDVGCGTGALSESILASESPAAIKGIDQSEGYIQYARRQVTDPRVSFEVGDAQALPVETGAYDVAVSGLVLNFVPDPPRAVAEMSRAIRQDGKVAVYVWDYAGRMDLMRYFWDAAVALNPAVQPLDEGERFPICQPEPLAALFRQARLQHIETRAIDVTTVFRDFDDYWTPFLGGQAPAPSYAMSLSEANRRALRERIRTALPITPDGTIRLVARAWAVQGIRS
jgi:SAM-dependent methyltransferase